MFIVKVMHLHDAVETLRTRPEFELYGARIVFGSIPHERVFELVKHCPLSDYLF